MTMKSSRTATWMGSAMLALTLAITGAVGCSSGSSPMSGTPPTQPQSTNVLVNMGDSPADGVLECAVTISAMSFTNTSGTSVPVTISSPMTIELAHLRGTMAPLVMPSIPQGTYNSASITISSATVTYMTSSSHNPQQQVINSPATVNIPLNPTLTVGSGAMVLNLDLNLASSVGMSGGTVTFTPTFNTSVATASSSATASPEQGGMFGIVGNVTGTSSSSFTMNTLQGMPMTCTTNGTTFAGMNGQNMTGMGMMSSGQDVIVNATFQANGTCNANSVTDMMGANGVMPIGIITATTGTPATSMTIFPDNGIGAGMMASFLANGITINLSGSATYGIDDAGVSMSGAPFPVTFGASNLAVGQNCSMAGSGSMQAPGSGGMGGMGGGFMDMGGMSASGVVLEPQGFGGTVVNASGGGFTLSLASDSAFTLLTGASSINVFAASGAQLNGLTAVANGQNVEIYGYLFYNAGAYNFVATQITLAPGAAA
jgi:hypothetical protein